MDLLLPGLPGILNHCLHARDRSTVTPGAWFWADRLGGLTCLQRSDRHYKPVEQSGLQCQGIWGTVWNGSISQRRQTVATCSVQLSPWGIRDPLCHGNSSCSFSLYLKETKLGSHTVRPVNGSPWGKGLENPLILKPLVEDQISFLSYHNKMPQIGWLNQQKFIFFFFAVLRTGSSRSRGLQFGSFWGLFP